jgi:hypothetical protein
MSKGLQAIYEYDQKAYLNPCEDRIHRLYQWLQMGVKPWEWDHEHYSNGHESYIGFFFPEDIENMKQIEQFKVERILRESRGNKRR